jgi:hypothetical protein
MRQPSKLNATGGLASLIPRPGMVARRVSGGEEVNDTKSNEPISYNNFECSASDFNQEGDKSEPTSPKHYQNGSMQTIEIIKSMLPSEEFSGFLMGNVVKYLSRYKHKNGLEDLAKAKVYLTWLEEHYGTGTIKIS